MDNFEKMIGQLFAESMDKAWDACIEKSVKPVEKTEDDDWRTITVKYRKDHENTPLVFTTGNHDLNTKMEDALALMGAVGTQMGDITDISGEVFTSEIVKRVSAIMLTDVFSRVGIDMDMFGGKDHDKH